MNGAAIRRNPRNASGDEVAHREADVGGTRAARCSGHRQPPEPV